MAYREATIEELTQIADRLRKHATTVYSVVSELKLRQQNTALVQLKLLLDHVFPRLDACVEGIENDALVNRFKAASLKRDYTRKRELSAKKRKKVQ